MSHVALAWLLHQPMVAAALIGARTTAQLSESLATEDVDIPIEIIRALSDVSALDADLDTNGSDSGGGKDQT